MIVISKLLSYSESDQISGKMILPPETMVVSSLETLVIRFLPANTSATSPSAEVILEATSVTAEPMDDITPPASLDPIMNWISLAV